MLYIWRQPTWISDLWPTHPYLFTIPWLAALLWWLPFQAPFVTCYIFCDSSSVSTFKNPSYIITIPISIPSRNKTSLRFHLFKLIFIKKKVKKWKMTCQKFVCVGGCPSKTFLILNKTGFLFYYLLGDGYWHFLRMI